jgi:hypothetical protein
MNTCPYADTPFKDTPFIRRYAVFSDAHQQGLVNLFIALTRANCRRAHLSPLPQEASLDQEPSLDLQELALNGVGAKF